MLLETKAKKPQRRYPTQHARGSTARRSTEPQQQQRFPPKCRQPGPRGEARKSDRNEHETESTIINK